MEFNSKVMKLNNTDSTPYLTYNSLSEIKFIKHAFSTRLGGASKGEFSTMNLAFNRGDNEADVIENYKRICASAGFDYESLTASAQDHNTIVRRVDYNNRGVGIYKPKDMPSVDALITNDPRVTLVTYYADCTPLFFVDVKNKAVGLAHAGWRGTVGRIAEGVVKKMAEEFSTDPSCLVCAIGPAISVCCYEVDKPCADEFYKLDGLDNSKFIFPKENDKFMIDLLECNRQILVAAGVRHDSITLCDICTNCSSDLLWSHRATKGHRGTMSAFICLK